MFLAGNYPMVSKSFLQILRRPANSIRLYYLNLPKPSNIEDVQNLQDIDLKTRLSHFDDSQRIFFLKCILKDDASPLGLILR